ncbi:MAG: hypothetical protein EBS56_08370 [Planctomycetia bacterium]|nr:hypothetical protein [Planctomycetia bacterium]
MSLAGTGTHSFNADSGRTITVASSAVLANKASESGTLDKSGAGTLVLQGANTYSGATTLSAGTLRLSNQNAIQNSTLTMNGGSLAFDSSVGGNAFTAGGLSGTSSGAGFDIALQNNAGSPAAVTLTVGGNNASTTYAGVLSAAGALTKSGSGVLTLTGANTFSGATTVSSGSLRIGSGGTTGAIGSTSGVSVASGATLAFNRSDNYGGNFTRTITGSGGVVLSSGTLTLQNTGNTFSGGIAVNGGVLMSLGNSAGNTITVNNGGSLGMAGTDTWGAATATSTPAITINAGGNMTTDGQFNSLRNLTLAGGTLSMNGGFASTASALVLGGTVTASGPVTSTIVVTSGSNNAIRLGRQGTSEATEFNVSDPAGSLSVGTVLDNNFGSISGLTKSGSGVLVLSAANIYSGPTTVSVGTLQVGNGGTAGSINASSGFTVASGATLAFNRSDNYGGALTNTFSGSGTIAVNSGTLGLNAAGSSGYSSNLGVVINNGGSVVLSHSDMFGGTGWDATASPAFTVNAGGVLSSTNSYNTLWNATLNGGTLRSNGGANSPAQAFALAGTLTIGGSTASLIESGTIGNGLNAVNISGNGNNTLTMNVADATGNANADLTVTAVLQNNRSTLSNLTKAGAGTLVLAAANTYTGTTTVNAGTLQIGSGGLAGSIGSTSGVSVASGATLAFNRSDSYGGAFDRQITGSGAVTLSSGSLVLTNNDTYSGATTISAGTLQIGNGSTAGAIGSTSGVSVASGATLAFNRSDNYGGNFTRLISGSGSVVLSSGTLTLQNTSNTFAGGYTVNGGVLMSSGTSITAANSVTVNSGGTFGMAGTDTWGAATTTSTPAVTINAGGNLTTDNQFNSLRNLTLAGGTVSLNGGLNSSAGALVLGGTVAVNGATTSTITVTTGSNNFIRLGRQNTSEATVFNVSNAAGMLAAGAPLQDNFGANSGLTKSGVGTMMLSGSNGYTGVTTVSAGTLQIGSGGLAGSIGSTSGVSVASGATLAFNRSDTAASCSRTTTPIRAPPRSRPARCKSGAAARLVRSTRRRAFRSPAAPRSPSTAPTTMAATSPGSSAGRAASSCRRERSRCRTRVIRSPAATR